MKSGKKGKMGRGKRENGLSPRRTGNALYSPAKSFESSIPTLATIEKPRTSRRKARGLSTVTLLSALTATPNKYTPKPPANPTDRPTKNARTMRAPNLFFGGCVLILQTNTFVMNKNIALPRRWAAQDLLAG